jgi:hypothetical protein
MATGTKENPIRGTRSGAGSGPTAAELAAAEAAAKAEAAKPRGLTGRKFAQVVAADGVGPRIPFEAAGIPCWVRLASAPTAAFRNFGIATADAPDLFANPRPEDRERWEELTAAQVDLCVASIQDCSLARKVGEVWQAAVPPETPPSAREEWLRDVLEAMDREVFSALMEEVLSINGMGEPVGNNSAPPSDS